MAKEQKGLNFLRLEGIVKALSEMNKREGHGLAYEINKNIFKITPVLKDFHERLDVTRKPFLIGEGEDLKVDPEKKEEAAEMFKKFDDELLNVDLEPFDEKLIKKAFKSSIFDGIDLTHLFDTLIK